MNQIKKLWRLQMLEEQQSKAQDQVPATEIARRLKQLKPTIETAQSEMKELKSLHQQIKEQSKQMALNNQRLRENCSQIDAKIYDGSLQMKEISNYQHKLQHLQGEVVELENQELDLMQQLEDIKGQWTEKKTQLEALTEEYKELHQTYLQGKEDIKTRAQGMAREISDLLQEIEPAYLKIYQEIKHKHTNPVGRVTKDICSGCHLGIPFDKLKQLKYQENAVYCSNCGRLLFWDPA